jgi:hypothetical protein
MKGIKKLEDARRTFRRFEELTRRLIAVPRVELEKELAEYERKKRQRTISSQRARSSDDQAPWTTYRRAPVSSHHNEQ